MRAEPDDEFDTPIRFGWTVLDIRACDLNLATRLSAAADAAVAGRPGVRSL